MNPQETRQAEELIFRIRDLGLAIVVIEHDMRFIFNLCDRVLCLVQGKALIEGTPAEVQSDPRVIEAYIGTGPEDAAELRGRAARRGRAMLEVKDLKVAYGRVRAVKGISFTVEQGQVVTLVGTNGAGKTTTLRTISGLIRPESGEIWFEGKRIDATPAHEVATRGLAHSPEGRRIFPRLTVEDNLMLGAFARRDRAGDRPGPGAGLHLFDDPEGRGGPSRPAPSPAASSRCWPSAGP